MIRVLNISNLEYGGRATTIMTYYRNLDRSKIQFDFLLTIDETDYHEEEAISLGARIFRRPMRSKRIIKSTMDLYRLLKSHPEYQIVHMHHGNHAVLIDVLVCWLCRVPVRIVHSREARVKFPPFISILRAILRSLTTHMLACSTEAGVALFGEIAKTSGKLILFPNIRDLTPFRFDPEQRLDTRRSMNLESNFVVLHIGRLVNEKNQSFMLDFFAAFLKSLPSAVLLIAGDDDGGLGASLEEQAARLGIEHAVRFLGLRRDIPNLLQAADIFVLPSLREGLPGAAIEAQAAGLPSLLSDRITPECKITGLVEFLPIDKGPELWAERMSAYRNFPRPDTTEEMNRAGYDVQNAAKRLEEFYLSALERDNHN